MRKWLAGGGWVGVAAAWAAACSGGSDGTLTPREAGAFDGFGAFGGASGSSGATLDGSAATGAVGGSGGSGGSSRDASAGTGATAGSAGEGGGLPDGSAGSAGAAGSGGCGSCDDHVPCTVDTCTAGKCHHEPDSKACEAKQVCDLLSGCIAGVICASTQDCTKQLGSDACKTNLACDQAMALCRWETLDKDKDGSPPIVCGGGDCDDSNDTAYPGATELCDGRDNNCDNQNDNGASCPGLQACTKGACSCPADKQCGDLCVDMQTDKAHCGSCSNACPSGADCVAGQCKCATTATVCSEQCVDLNTDPMNCGICDAQCAPGYSCQNKQCLCTKTSCKGQCVDIQTDVDNCGGCGNKCLSCNTGQCGCAGGSPACKGHCVDYLTDRDNCGTCGNKCSAGQQCRQSTCKNCPVGDMVVLLDHSGSASAPLPSAMSRWTAIQNATKAFFSDPLSASLGVGLQFMPTYPPQTSCGTDADCTSVDLFATCDGGYCSWYYTSCEAADYAQPAVPIALLSTAGHPMALNTAIDQQVAEGSTPMIAALEGVLQYAKQRAQSSGDRVAVVLVTDGINTDCPMSGLTSDVVTVAQSYSSASPAVLTYVIGVGLDNPDDWGLIAAAGGTVAASVGSTQEQIQGYLESIRSTVTACP
jgi:hypothetical protein